jgi:AAA15 family ATPase/GTPase
MSKLQIKSPSIKLKSLYILNLKAYKEYDIDFTKDNNIKPFICFVGDNGIGKSTALNVIQLLFNQYDSYSPERLFHKLSPYVRHDQYEQYAKHFTYKEYIENPEKFGNFLIKAKFETDILGTYEVIFDRTGFIKDHPDEIKPHLMRLCYYARFDQELNNFQLETKHWDKFKKLFQSVTGYEVEPTEDLFSSDELNSKLLGEKYVLSFTVQKKNEKISNRECSNGERKVIKSFSTLLNQEIKPKIILIDDIAMHVALGRHLALIKAMQDCYPESQIFSTTHSYRLTKDLSKLDEIYDLRLMHANDIVKKEPFRLKIIDELDDAIYKLSGIRGKDSLYLQKECEKIKEHCLLPIRDLEKFENNLRNLLKEVSDFYTIRLLSIRTN